MSLGLVGKKCGMTRVFTETGNSIPVTVIEVTPNRVTQIKTKDVDGYSAVQITAGTRKPSRVKKPMAGHFAKAGVEAGVLLREFRVDEGALADIKVGDEFAADIFEEGQFLDVQAVSKGKGFAGPVKRHNFQMQDATHGNSLSHRAHGSIGQCQSPGRVFKGKKMAGQMGNAVCSVTNQPVVRIDKENNVLLIGGAVPGGPGAYVVLNATVKNRTGAPKK